MLKKHSRRVVTYEPVLTELGNALRKLRVDAGISQTSMANHIGVSPAYLCDCELGRNRLSFSATILFLQRVKLGEEK